MTRCEACGETSDNLLYTCNECGKTLCSDHRLPEKHFCGIRDRVRDDESTDNGQATRFTSPLSNDEPRPECKTEDCTNTSDPGSAYCPKCLNEHHRNQEDSPRTQFGETDCKATSCNNVAGHGESYCLECRRDQLNSESSPAVETTTGTPAESENRVQGTDNSDVIRSLSNRVRTGAKRARDRVSGAFWMVVGLIFLPFSLLKGLVQKLYGFASSTTGVLLLGLVLLAVAAGPLGIISIDAGGIDNTLSGIQDGAGDIAAEANDDEELNEAEVQQRVHEEVNDRRAERGLAKLEYSTDLQEVARFHANNMYSEGFFSHTAPNGSGLQDRYSRFGIGCSGGENIAKTHAKITVLTDNGSSYYETNEELARGIVNQWMNSTGHRENILRERYSSEGIGIVIRENPDGEGFVVYAVQNFCA